MAALRAAALFASGRDEKKAARPTAHRIFGGR